MKKEYCYCPQCGFRLTFDDSDVGKSYDCPACAEFFVIKRIDGRLVAISGRTGLSFDTSLFGKDFDDSKVPPGDANSE